MHTFQPLIFTVPCIRLHAACEFGCRLAQKGRSHRPSSPELFTPDLGLRSLPHTTTHIHHTSPVSLSISTLESLFADTSTPLPLEWKRTTSPRGAVYSTNHISTDYESDDASSTSLRIEGRFSRPRSSRNYSCRANRLFDMPGTTCHYRCKRDTSAIATAPSREHIFASALHPPRADHALHGPQFSRLGYHFANKRFRTVRARNQQPFYHH
jgi:hypothetical protein